MLRSILETVSHTAYFHITEFLVNCVKDILIKTYANAQTIPFNVKHSICHPPSNLQTQTHNSCICKRSNQ